MNGEEPERIEFNVEKNQRQVESRCHRNRCRLSLWIYSIGEMEPKGTQKNDGKKAADTIKGDWLQQDVELKRQIIRLLGTDNEDLRRDISWWLKLDEGIRFPQSTILTKCKTIQGTDKGRQPVVFGGPIGFLELECGTSKYRMHCPGISATYHPDVFNRSSSDHQPVSPWCLTLNSEGSLETLLGQHIFTAFMWAIAKDVSAKRIDSKDQTIIGHPDTFILDTAEALRSLRLENTVLLGVANAIQRSELGCIQEAYLCIIPPLSYSKKLLIELVVHFVRRQMKSQEVLGNWGKDEPVCRKLFEVCQSFGTRHIGFLKATAIFIDIFLSIIYHLLRENQQGRNDYNMSTLERLRGDIVRALNPMKEPRQQPRPDSLPHIIHYFAQVYATQKRLDLALSKDLSPFSVSEIPRFLSQPTTFTNLMTAFYDRRAALFNRCNSNERDILGWSPLHYAAVTTRRLKSCNNDVNHDADSKVTDLVEWTPLHYAIESVKESELEPVIWTLLQGGVDFEMRGRDGTTPLHCAAKRGCSSHRYVATGSQHRNPR